MAKGVTVTETDMGKAKLMEQLAIMKTRPSVKIGVMSGKPLEDDPNITLAGLAAVHEFGAKINHPGGTPYMVTSGGAVFLKKGDARAIGHTKPHLIVIPQRSFLRKTVIDHRDKYQKRATKILGQIAAGRQEVYTGLSLMGLLIEGDTKRTISKGVSPPNAPSTIRRKKSSKPLIDTGRLRQSITHEVDRNQKAS